MGCVVLADIGIDANSDWFEIGEPSIPCIARGAHKYSRGLVHCLAGEMPGAIGLTAMAAARAMKSSEHIADMSSVDRPSTGVPKSVAASAMPSPTSGTTRSVSACVSRGSDTSPDRLTKADGPLISKRSVTMMPRAIFTSPSIFSNAKPSLNTSLKSRLSATGFNRMPSPGLFPRMPSVMLSSGCS